MSEPETPPRRSPPPPPTMGPTRPATLILSGLATAAVAWLLVTSYYTTLPPFPWLPAVTLVGLAVLEAYAAVNTRARVERRPGRDPVDPLAVARFVVLAKASSLAGAIFAGFYAGLLGWLVIEQTNAASNDIPATTGGLIASLALVGAALWLERSCRVPNRPDDENRGPDEPVQ